MKDLLKEAIAAIQERTGAFEYLGMLKGLDAAAIRAIEEQLEVQFPEELREALEVYGCTAPIPKNPKLVISIPHYGDMGLLSRDQIIGAWKALRSGAGSSEHDNDIDGLEKVYWSPRWIPVASASRNYIDTEPYQYDLLILDEKSKRYGTVIHWTGQGPVRVVGKSFREYLEEFVDSLNSPMLQWDESYGFSF